MVKILLVSLVLTLSWACDGEEGRGFEPEPIPTPTSTPAPECIPNEELIDSECLAEDLFLACNRYFCEELVADSMSASIIPSDSFLGFECSPFDCETIFCGFVTYSELSIMDLDGFPGIFGLFADDVINTPDIEFGPCEFLPLPDE